MDMVLERGDFLERLKQEYRLTYMKVQQLGKELAGAIRGSLVRKKVGQYTYYDLQVWEEGKRKRSYVRKNEVERIARQIEQRRYQEEQLRGQKSYLEQLRKCLRHFRVKAEEVMESYEAERRESVRREREKEVEQEAARQKPYGEGCRYRTLEGEYVRWKSEQVIANLLYALGVPYSYEPVVRLGRREVRGDFWVKSKVNPRREYYWEHYGMMDEEEYRERAAEKQRLYRANGYRVGKNLIETYEDKDGLDAQEIWNMLKVYKII